MMSLPLLRIIVGKDSRDYRFGKHRVSNLIWAILHEFFIFDLLQKIKRQCYVMLIGFKEFTAHIIILHPFYMGFFFNFSGCWIVEGKFHLYIISNPDPMLVNCGQRYAVSGDINYLAIEWFGICGLAFIQQLRLSFPTKKLHHISIKVGFFPICLSKVKLYAKDRPTGAFYFKPVFTYKFYGWNDLCLSTVWTLDYSRNVLS